MNCTMNIVIFLFIYRLCVCLHNSKRSYKNFKIINLEGQKHDVMKMIEYIKAIDNNATYEIGRLKTHVLIRPNLLARYTNVAAKINVKITVIVKDYSKLFSKETKRQNLSDLGNISWTDYYDIDSINKYLELMHKKFSFWSSVIVGGESFQDRKITGIRVNTNVALPTSKPKPVVVIEGGTHAREWMTPAATMYFIHQLLTNQSTDMTNIRNSFDWHIFPVINPDGYHYSMTVDRMWRKSRSLTKNSECVGVDLNRNWNYQFGSKGTSKNPCDYQTYGGTRAFSEVETRSMASYISKLNNIIAFFSIHTPLHSIIVPYSDSHERIENYTQLQKLAKSANAYCGEYYDFGTAPMLLGKMSGSSMDWVYYTKKPPITFTLELRGDSFFAPSYEIPEVGEAVTKMLTGIFLEAHKQGLYEIALPYG